ncbi:MAG: hypothetical protein NZM25_02385 [Leptospiraceae bacterium]|nr:hypothetical protein [Leptospiraceae bacterium]MDW8307682.1 hypothetical protein [Leptospiraceae bacterium]
MRFLLRLILFFLFINNHLYAAEALKDKDSQIERFRQILKYGNSQQVRETLVKLTRLSTDEQKSLLPELKELTQSRDAQIQRRLVEAIGSFSFSDLDEHLAVALGHPSDDVFFAACAAIEKKKPPSASMKIIEKIKEADFTQAGNKIADLLRSLAAYQTSDLDSFLMEKLRDKNTYPDYRNQILRYFAVTKSKHPELPTVVKELSESEEESLTLRSYAVYAAGELGYRNLKDLLLQILMKIDNITDSDEKKKHARLRLQLISALIKLEAENIDKLLFEMARDDDETVRLRAIRQLSQFPRENVKELLRFKASYDTSPRVQKEAQKILEKMEKGQKEESLANVDPE